MKKRIYIIISSVLLLLLSGCDAILDSVYPPDIQNSIEVRLGLASDLSDNYDKVTLQLVPLDVYSELDLDSIITVELWISDIIEYNFDGLPANEYRAFAFVDINGDNIPNWEEPSTELWNESGYTQTGVFDFLNNDIDTDYRAVGSISTDALISRNWLEQFNEGLPGPLHYNNFAISGYDFIDSSQYYETISYDVVPGNYANTVYDIEWKITDIYGNAIQYNGSFDYNYSVSYFDTYFDIDLTKIDPLLHDAFWSFDYFILEVKVTYVGGDTFENFFYINI